MPTKTTRRKPAARKSTTGSKSRWSDEQIADWRRRDEEIRENSTAYLEDADSVRHFARDAAGGRVSLRILGYSLRNQVLLEKQAAELGFILTDVASAKQWRARGRRVKPEWHGQGLRLVAPNTRQKKDADPGAEEQSDDETTTVADDEDQNEGDDQGETESQHGSDKSRKAKFKTVAVFDIAQTEVIPTYQRKDCPLCSAKAGEPCHPDCTCGVCVDHMLDDDPADIVWNRLIEQIGKAEYAYDWPAPASALHGERVRVDHDARTVYADMSATAEDPEAVADLAAALADIIARTDRAKAVRRAERRTARAALTAA